MPVIEFNGPPLDQPHKEKLVRLLTEAGMEVTGLPQEAFTVLIREMDPANVGVAGELLINRPKK